MTAGELEQAIDKVAEVTNDITAKLLAKAKAHGATMEESDDMGHLLRGVACIIELTALILSAVPAIIPAENQ